MLDLLVIQLIAEISCTFQTLRFFIFHLLLIKVIMQRSALTLEQRNDLNLRYKSLTDLYQFLSIVMDLHLPMKTQCSLSFLQDLIEGKKHMLERNKVPRTKIPTWPELSVSKLLPQILADKHLRHYFPDKFPKGKVPDREYFWGVIAAIKPGYFKALVDDALKQRSQISHDADRREETLKIQNEVLVKLLDNNQSWLRPKKGGRSLVFSKAAPRKETKKRRLPVNYLPEKFPSAYERNDQLFQQASAPVKRIKNTNVADTDMSQNRFNI